MSSQRLRQLSLLGVLKLHREGHHMSQLPRQRLSTNKSSSKLSKATTKWWISADCAVCSCWDGAPRFLRRQRILEGATIDEVQQISAGHRQRLQNGFPRVDRWERQSPETGSLDWWEGEFPFTTISSITVLPCSPTEVPWADNIFVFTCDEPTLSTVVNRSCRLFAQSLIKSGERSPHWTCIAFTFRATAPARSFTTWRPCCAAQTWTNSNHLGSITCN